MLTANRLRQVLHYDPATGVFTWRVRANSKVSAGSRAGGMRKDGYRRIGIDGERHFEHRLAWLYVTGQWPERDIDHRDLDTSNNSFDNLRLATASQNHGNIARRADNTSGFKGVSWAKQNAAWRAAITFRGKSIYLGLFPTPEEAHAAYVTAATTRFGEFARAA